MSTAFARADRAPAWAALAGHFAAHGRTFDLREAFARDADRFATLTFAAPEVFVDLSKNFVDAAVLRFLADLGRECGLEARRDAMLAGAPINASEGRAVLHTALRAPPGVGAHADEVHAVLDAMLGYAEQVRSRAAMPGAAAGGGLRHIVNIGIGGSDLGPQMVVPALAALVHPRLEFHFVSNVDPHDLLPLLGKLDPREVLFVIASKTFTTQETMANAETAKAWFLENGGTRIEDHFVATTSNVAAARSFGIATTFGFWDWVGGRYSLWSSIGLPIAIALGAASFRALLAGAWAMDEHFASTPIERNVPMLLGLVDVWLRDFHGCTSRCVAPYHQGLRRLPAYLQQLEMESNGKRVDRAGELLPYATSPVVWGEPGTNGQHAFFQMLHQGTDVIPVEFILVAEPELGDQPPALAERVRVQHRMLLANGLAQGQALMQGRSADAALAESRGRPLPEGTSAEALAAQRSFPGNRPSTTLVLERLTPRSLGALIALYEHRVFSAGAVWGINSFDQWGVELGKSLGNALLAGMEPGASAAAPLDASTAGLLARLKP